MNKQPEALPAAIRLAEWLESELPLGWMVKERAAAKELRRLHQSEQEGWRYAAELEQERERLHEVNQELLEACKAYIEWAKAEENHKETTFWERIEMCRTSEILIRAAIAKATGETT